MSDVLCGFLLVGLGILIGLLWSHTDQAKVDRWMATQDADDHFKKMHKDNLKRFEQYCKAYRGYSSTHPSREGEPRA